MGIVNVTPDSFSDGGRFLDPDAAVEHGLRLLDEGADALDVGGESTRPGAAAVPAEVESARVVPVIAGLARRAPGALLSIDTTKAAVARAALDAGARIVNDVSAGADPAMLPLVATAGAAIVLMHRRGSAETMQLDTAYDDVVAEVHGFLAGRAAAARAAGIVAGRILLDPGIGFGKDAVGNLRLLRELPALARLGHAVVVGASRKSFIGMISGAPVAQRLGGSLAVLADAATLARLVVRVHDVAATVQFLTLLAAVRGAA
ncbi:MAG: dihydropteroate synthase [Acidobacteria bacterium]|nr:dihydropteroate synthase [Acidobacteriota bacterium]